MKLIMENWKKFLNETKISVQDAYESFMDLQIIESEKIDRTEVISFIRAIPNVTTVQNMGQLQSSPRYYVATYSIRFVLKKGQEPGNYYTNILKPYIKKINGVSILRDKGFKRIEVSWF